MNNNKGFTLIELVIASVIILIVSLGFFSWSITVIQRNVASGNNNTAYDMAMDIGDRLVSMPESALIQHDTALKFVGFSGAGQLLGCVAGAPATNLSLWVSPVTRGEYLTIYTDPFPAATLYLYDNNTCTSANPYCLAGSAITAGANANIDHPNDVSLAVYDNVRPVRFIRNTTYYAVWSVAYMPCSTVNVDRDRRKVFVTVYWLDPEPTETTAATVVPLILSGTYGLKSVSIVIDRAIGIN